MTAPNIRLAFGSTRSYIISAAAFTYKNAEKKSVNYISNYNQDLVLTEIKELLIIKLQRERENTSYKVRSFPPVMFQTIPVARSIPMSSKGD